MLTITLTPSEFMMAVFDESFTPDQLAKNAGASTEAMRNYYKEQLTTKPNTTGQQIVIYGTCHSRLVLTDSVIQYAELLTVAEKMLDMGHTLTEVISALLENGFEKYVISYNENDHLMKALFDHYFNWMSHLDNNKRLVHGS